MSSLAEINERWINTTRGSLNPDAQNYDDIALLLAEVERLKKDNGILVKEIVDKVGLLSARRKSNIRLVNALVAIRDQALPQKGVGKLAHKITEIADEALKAIP